MTAGWVSRTFLGWCLGFVFAIAFVVVADGVGAPGLQSPLPVGMGLGVGLLQGRWLASRLGHAGRWVIATSSGLALPFLVADLSHLLGTPVPYALAAYVAAGGVVAAAFQWLLLRAVVASPVWWLLVTPVGWLLGGSTVWINERLLPKTPGLIGALQYVSVVLSGGLVLGIACVLAWRLAERDASS